MDFEGFKKEYEHKKVEEFLNQVPEKPIVSVCVQTFQHALYIKECLDGILMQKTDFPFEILLGEDASTDGTREICIEYAQKYPHKIRLFLHHRENNISINGNPSGRFNMLYNLFSAKGKYIALCEGDDYWTDPYKLQNQVDFLEGNPDYGIVHTKYTIKNEFTKTENIHEKKVVNSQSNEFINYLFTGDMRTLTVMFRLKCFTEIKSLLPQGFIEEESPYGDRPIYLSIASISKIKYIDKVTGVYRIYESVSATRSSSILKKYEKFKTICLVNLQLLKYLKIDNTTYKNILEKRLKRANYTLFLLKTPILNKVYNFIYKKYKEKRNSSKTTSFY